MSAPRTTEPLRTVASTVTLAHPLDDFYTPVGLPLPPIEALAGEAVREPYRTLLVHDRDMTPTLEGYYGQTIHLRLLRRQQRGHLYFRAVVLMLADGVTPVEFGASKIDLGLLGAEARRLILEEREPLGTILATCQVPHRSRPQAFLSVRSDAFINRALGLAGAHLLCGRRNTLLDATERPLAEVVEILPPAEERSSAGPAT